MDHAIPYSSAVGQRILPVSPGDAGGRLKSAGNYLNFPDYGKPGHRTINTLYNTLLQVADVDRNDFGFFDPNLDEPMHRGPLAELLH